MNDYNFSDYYYQNMNLGNGYNYNNMGSNMYSKPIELDSSKGFLRGNMFDNLYDPYRNYIPVEINSINERQALLEKVQQYNFALIDLNLYLDNYPTDMEVIKIFNNYRNMYLGAVSNYEKAYGPLCIENNPVNASNWVWDANPWPWEVQV